MNNFKIDMDSSATPQDDKIATPPAVARNDVALNEGNGLDVTRRGFLSLLGASVALATSACRKPVHKILPFVKEPENLKPGISKYYASTYPLAGTSYGVLVETREGRPIKLEGNPDHPLSQGATHHLAQASILDVYDSDRKKYPTIGASRVSWEQWIEVTSTILKNAQNKNKRVCVLHESSASPTLQEVLRKFSNQFKNISVIEFEPTSSENETIAFEECFGLSSIPQPKLDKASVILSLNSDFLGDPRNNVSSIKEWTKTRKIPLQQNSMSRLYSVESFLSLTGTNADHRLALKPSQLLEFALGLATILIEEYQIGDKNLIPIFEKVSRPTYSSAYSEAFLKTLALDLSENIGKSLVLVGPQESKELHIAGLLLNALLKSFSNTLNLKNYTTRSKNGYGKIKNFLEDLKHNKVDVLVTLGGNPAYHFGEAFSIPAQKIQNNIRLSLYEDETSQVTRYDAPLSHFLESWDDSKPTSTSFSIHQPTLRSLYQSRCTGEMLLEWQAHLENITILPTEAWISEIKNNFKHNWNEILQKGYINVDSTPLALSPINVSAVSRMIDEGKYRSFGLRRPQNDKKNKQDDPSSPHGFDEASNHNDAVIELQFEISHATFDGRFANNGWLQELPHPVTKITWDNVANMSSKTAQTLNLKNEDVIELAYGNKILSLPVFIQQGLAEGVITTQIGYGRTHAGHVGSNIGSNVFPLLMASDFSWSLTQNVSINKTGKTYKIATTQKHADLMGRPIAHEAALDDYKNNPDFPKQDDHSESFDLYKKEHTYPGHKWGMSIDLTSCVGCNACVTACNTENNVPVVGKDQVLKGREMHWIRIDRYYRETEQESPAVIHEPMLCQHCEDAPCENVCPVNATTHSEEGLNEMTYNRCIGTRYCSNNCPYKVRRFNFFDYTDDILTPEELGKNPDVTIRMRGVMEKCTFCVQRIQEARIDAKSHGHERISDGGVKSACQQVCPADAIVFGDLNDPSSQVAKLSKSPHGFHILQHLNTKPSITYLAKIRNPHPNLKEFESL
ncbi:MAG: 4Fe-4S dicluster domain-containing protein [Deltaproteobacteria bacterium]|nr:4Fe-4S dicluster domain-containing protein [Deltaproteobacteria bacterium]